jgi:hypothetical protein
MERQGNVRQILSAKLEILYNVKGLVSGIQTRMSFDIQIWDFGFV